jgi:hypothetical protein
LVELTEAGLRKLFTADVLVKDLIAGLAKLQQRT